MLSIDLPDFALHGRFGALHRYSRAADLVSILGPSDPETTYPNCYSYGNFGLEVIPGEGSSHAFRLRICVSIPHPEHFYVPYESWKESRKRFWHSLQHDFPDSRFDCVLDDLLPGASIEDLAGRYLSDAEDLENSNPTFREYLLPSGITMIFSNSRTSGPYTLYSLDTRDRWGPDMRHNKALYRSGESSAAGT